MFRDQRDVPALRRMLREIDSQAVRRVVFAVPTGPSWPLPVYELALLLATRARERHQDTEVTLVTPEQTPLGVFGAEPSRLVGGVLAERGVSFVGDSVPDHVRDDGSLVLRSGKRSMPTGWSRRLGCTDDRSAACRATARGSSRPTASGGCMGPTRLRRGRRDHISPQAGGYRGPAGRRDRPVDPDFRGRSGDRAPDCARPQARLIGGEQHLFLRAELDELGRATSATLTRSASEEVAVGTKVLARYLTPYLEQIGSTAAVKN